MRKDLNVLTAVPFFLISGCFRVTNPSPVEPPEELALQEICKINQSKGERFELDVSLCPYLSEKKNTKNWLQACSSFLCGVKCIKNILSPIDLVLKHGTIYP